MINFLSPETLSQADATRHDESGEQSVLALIKASHLSPLTGEHLRKGAKPARFKNPHADDAVEKDDDEDEDDDLEDTSDATSTEQADLKTRARLRAQADRKKASRHASNEKAACKAIRTIHAAGAQPEDPDV